jgi:alcohol dehydrogenase
VIGSYGRNRADLAATLAWAAEGKLRPIADRVFPLAEAPQALRLLRARQALGKLLVRP